MIKIYVKGQHINFEQHHFFGGFMKKFRVSIAVLIMGCMPVLFATAPVSKSSCDVTTQNPCPCDHQSMKNKNECRRFALLYQTYKTNHPNPIGNYIIPRKIHFIWLGGKLPSSFQKTIDTWKEFHPSWEIKLWTKADVKSFKFINKTAFNKAKTDKEKSTIWRYEILYRYGGLFVDLQTKCHNSFADLHQTSEFYAFTKCSKSKIELSNSIIGSQPNHPIIQLCTFLIRPGQNVGPDYFTRCFSLKANDLFGKVVPLPMNPCYK